MGLPHMLPSSGGTLGLLLWFVGVAPSSAASPPHLESHVEKCRVAQVKKKERGHYTDLRRLLLQSSDLTLTGMLSDFRLNHFKREAL